jgi:Arc/MetJ-type ribon-helix-helix transcriptional regulator
MIENKIKVSISINGQTVRWIDEQIKREIYRNRSHAFDVAGRLLMRSEAPLDSIDRGILEAIRGASSGSSMELGVIVSRVNANLRSTHDHGKIQDRLEIMESKRYVETEKTAGVGDNNISAAKLTAFGREYLREIQSF